MAIDNLHRQKNLRLVYSIYMRVRVGMRVLYIIQSLEKPVVKAIVCNRIYAVSGSVSFSQIFMLPTP